MTNDSEEFTAYLTHLLAEHRRLEESLRSIEQLWVGDNAPRLDEVMPQVIDELEALRAELAHHFKEEETGGCLDEAVSRQPHLGHEADRLEHEHVDLLGQVDRLIAGLQVVSQSLKTANEAKEDFRRFTEQLRAHEDAENRILEKSFGVELQ